MNSRSERIFSHLPRSKKPTALSAPLYVEALMSWVQNQLDDEKLFPQKIGESVPFISMPHNRTNFRVHRDCIVASLLTR
jgi:hypothetical protein